MAFGVVESSALGGWFLFLNFVSFRKVWTMDDGRLTRKRYNNDARHSVMLDSWNQLILARTNDTSTKIFGYYRISSFRTAIDTQN